MNEKITNILKIFIIWFATTIFLTFLWWYFIANKDIESTW